MNDGGVEEEEEERVTADSYGALDVSSVNDAVWMIRVPQKLAQLIDNTAKGTELGELVFKKGGTVNGKTIKPSLTVHITPPEDTKKDGGALPVEYSMQAMTKKIPKLCPFVRNPNNGSCQILGTVSRTANLQVTHQDSNYRAMLKDRLIASNVNNNRFVKPVQVSESIVTNHRSKNSFGNAVSQVGKRQLESNLPQEPAAKKTRRFEPNQPLRRVLFDLFGQEPLWTMKDIKAAAIEGGSELAARKKADVEIRDILRNEIGTYHRSGDHKGKWELRAEFQNSQS